MTRSLVALLLSGAALGAGCKEAVPPSEFGVNLTIDARTLPDTERQKISVLLLRSEGAEQFSTVLDVAGAVGGGELRFRYVPAVRTGALFFTAEARSGTAQIGAGQSGQVALTDGQAANVTITLALPGAMRHVGDKCATEIDPCDGAGGCVDGYCCAMSCRGACQACDLPGMEGACMPLPAGVAPRAQHTTCAATAATLCGLDGLCDGAGTCRPWPSGTACGAPTCNAATNMSTAEGQCNGTGMCVSAPALTCAPYKCQDGKQCFTACTDSSQCVGAPCNTTVTPGSCGPKPNGASCLQDSDCQNMHCVEPDVTGAKICCDTACNTNPCMSCRVQATRGTCSIGPTTVQCRAASCTANVATLAQSCAGDGSCPASATQACDPYKCGGTTCKTSCAADADCQTGKFCLKNKCTNFGGIFQPNMAPDCTFPCQDGNPLAAGNACACPPNFPTSETISSYDDCAGGASGSLTTINICATATRTTQNAWGGAYITYPTSSCGANQVNPYTSAFTCPPDTNPAVYSVYNAFSSCGQSYSITMCTSPTAPITTWGGAFQTDDNLGQGGNLCRVPNPKTSACSCPAGTSQHGLRILVDRGGGLSPRIIGGVLFYCTP